MHATPKVFVALPLVALVALVLLGGLVAVVMLLANPKTRMAGAVLVLILVGLVVSGGIGLLAVARHAAEREAVLSRNASEMAQEVARHAAEREATPGALLPSPPTAGHVAAETVLNHWVNELPTPATAGEVAAKPQAATEQSEGVLRAVWKAVGKAVADTKKQEKIAAGSSTAKPPATGPDEDKPTVARRPDWVDTQPGPVGGG